MTLEIIRQRLNYLTEKVIQNNQIHSKLNKSILHIPQAIADSPGCGVDEKENLKETPSGVIVDICNLLNVLEFQVQIQYTNNRDTESIITSDSDLIESNLACNVAMQG